MACPRAKTTRLAVGVAFACLIALVGTSPAAWASTVPAPANAGPTISLGNPAQSSPGAMTISGAGFTPGGKVYVAILDPWGRQLYRPMEVTTTLAHATFSHYFMGTEQPAGDPTNNAPGGTFLVSLDHLCGTHVMVHAYDWQADVWSNMLAFTADCSNADDLVPQSTTP